MRRFSPEPMDKKLKGKPGESRRRKAAELPRYSQRNVSGAARFDGWDFPVGSFLIWRNAIWKSTNFFAANSKKILDVLPVQA